MAYHDITSPALVLNHEISVTRRFFAGLGASFNRTMLWLMENSAGNARVKAVQRLNAKTDAELAALNIRREDIVQHVFRDLYYV